MDDNEKMHMHHKPGTQLLLLKPPVTTPVVFASRNMLFVHQGHIIVFTTWSLARHCHFHNIVIVLSRNIVITTSLSSERHVIQMRWGLRGTKIHDIIIECTTMPSFLKHCHRFDSTVTVILVTAPHIVVIVISCTISSFVLEHAFLTLAKLSRRVDKATDTFSRMRSEGFPFIVGGLGVGAVFAWLASCRRLSSFVVVVASQIRGHWGKLLQVTFHGCVTCQFAPLLLHCDLHENDMSRKKRDAFRCTGAAFCEIRSFLRSSIGISVWRVVFLCWMAVPLGFAFQGVASKLCFCDKSQLKWRFWWMGVCSERVEIIPNLWCGANFVEAHMRWYCPFSWQAQGIVRLRGVTEVTFRGRRSTLCALDVRTRKESCRESWGCELWEW